CLVAEVVLSYCPPTNMLCLCNDGHYNQRVTECVLSNCTIREGLTTQKTLFTSCGTPQRSRRAILKATSLAGLLVSFTSLALRLAARSPFCNGQLGMDDLTIVLAWLHLSDHSLSGHSLVLIWVRHLAGHDGFGNEIWTIRFNGITTILKKFWAVEKLYIFTIWLTKMSLLIFYLRIFPDRKFRRRTYSVLALCCVTVVALVLACVFECQPISYAWDRWDGEHEGTCTHINAQGWANAGINIIFDIIIIALPLPQIYRLQISRERKIGIMIMFTLGVFVTIASIIRLRSLITFAASINPTYDYVDVTLWSLFEIVVGIVMACLPGNRALIRFLWAERVKHFSQSNETSGVSKASV
ncbi:hypothetical protein BU24DRAFT_359618, partial [Aaosphaeria arxii CBS 175.79]